MIAPFGPPPGFTISWSYPNPTAIPLISILKLEAGWSVSAFRVKTAVLFPPFPGARFPPALTVTRALIWAVEFPPSVPLLLTVTLSSPRLPELPELFTRRVPPFTIVPPE